jgi:hypothetical protein
MKAAWSSLVIAALLTTALSGCATASLGSRQRVYISSEPSGAECGLTREGEDLGKVTTPGSREITRSRKPINVVCTKAGYEEARSVMNSMTQGSPIIAPGGSGVAGGIVSGVFALGSVVDMSSGADTHYTPLRLTLTPLSAADREAAASASPAPAQPAPSAVSWKAVTVLVPERSTANCSSSGVEYAFGFRGDTLIVDEDHTRAFSVALPADGTLKQEYVSRSGNRLEMAGNARTKDLEIVNAGGTCRWKLKPRS